MNAESPASAFDERLPTELESSNAETLRQIVASQIKEDGETVIKIANEQGKTLPVTLSPALAHSFLEVLRLVSSGRGFHLIPLDSQLTTQEAADILNVSRPHLIKLLEREDIGFTKVGRHRRIKASDLLEYKEGRDAKRANALKDMAEFDGEHGLL
ncbi:helix-turn-helix domain-containing protein [Sedimentitalea todarodis]|uniref:Helix-turn-helix domain-containing protein n=1 Tax=Sedimentitalea todarodis TaxID=1631240 RepID=A0ABU3VCY2_9RHOB|nr:helix-turn-helix domain-containing protein [Sedimentitalea todarodis]MDU9004038.1 helix-turn-helix domain-containing protein [Sedimentitalea todarodis]